jgi:hypothetical protein
LDEVKGIMSTSKDKG